MGRLCRRAAHKVRWQGQGGAATVNMGARWGQGAICRAGHGRCHAAKARQGRQAFCMGSQAPSQALQPRRCANHKAGLARPALPPPALT